MPLLYETRTNCCLAEIVGEPGNAFRHNLEHNGDRRLYKSRLSGSRKAAIRQIPDLILSARSGIGQDGHVRLIGDTEFFKHVAAIFAVVPDRNEIEFHLRIVFDDFSPAAAFQFGQAIGTPRRPEMDHGQLGRFDRFQNLLLPAGKGSARSDATARMAARTDNRTPGIGSQCKGKRSSLNIQLGKLSRAGVKCRLPGQRGGNLQLVALRCR